MVSTSNPSFHSKFRFSIFILVNIIAILHLGKDLLFSFSHSLYLPFLGFLLLLTMDLLFLLDGFIPFLRPRSGFLFREVMNVLFLGFCWLFYLSLSLSKKCKPCLPFTLLLLLISILSLLPLQINIPHLSPSDPDKTQRILYHLCQSSLLFLLLLYGFFVRKHNIYFLLALLCCVVSTILFLYTLSSSSSFTPSSTFYQTWEWFEEDWTLLLELSLLLLVIFTSNGWLSTFYNHTH
jgi:hypothetical protein